MININTINVSIASKIVLFKNWLKIFTDRFVIKKKERERKRKR